MSFDNLSRGHGCICTPDEIKAILASVEPKEYKIGTDVLPVAYDMGHCMPQTVRDQGKANACAAFACCAALEGLPLTTRDGQDESERFLYYEARLSDGVCDPLDDRGTYLASVIKVLQVKGSCPEGTCPYIPDPLAAPTDVNAAEGEAERMAITAFKLSQGIVTNKPDFGKDKFGKRSLYLCDAMKQVLFLTKTPVITSFRVIDKWTLEEACKAKGVLPLPKDKERLSKLGSSSIAHAVVIVGYDDNKQVFRFKNSYGKGWGDQGYGYMPYDYLEFLDDSFVIIERAYCPHGAATQPDTCPLCRSSETGLPPEWSEHFKFPPGGKQPREIPFKRSDSKESESSTDSEESESSTVCVSI